MACLLLLLRRFFNQPYQFPKLFVISCTHFVVNPRSKGCNFFTFVCFSVHRIKERKGASSARLRGNVGPSPDQAQGLL